MVKKTPLRTISGKPGHGLFHTFRGESFMGIFLITSFVTALTMAFGIVVKEVDGPIDKLLHVIGQKTKSDIHKNTYLKVLVHFVILFLFTFLFLYILYQLFGYGHSDLGPCQKVVKCN